MLPFPFSFPNVYCTVTMDLLEIRRSMTFVPVCVSSSVVTDSLRPMDCSLPGSSVYGILQARILVWVAIPFSRGSSQPSDFEPESPALQANSLPLSYLGSPSLNLGLPQSSRLESASPNPVFRAVNDPITPHIIA